MQLNAGATLQNGKYVILKCLGQGGFGITYAARQTNLDRTVAIKEFFMKDCCEREEETDYMRVPTQNNRELVGKFKKKFVREARMIASLNHPHIVHIIDIFDENETAYYVMDYMPGGSLSDKVKKEGRFSEVAAEKMVRQISSALEYIHTKNMVHLDVKPANILLNVSGEAILIDFGISKHYDSTGEQTSSTPVGISKGFAPLEQGRGGSVSQFSPATDIYALGATLYYLLVGQIPPEASIVYEEGLDRPANISDRLWGVIAAAMQPRRKDRPQDICQFMHLFEKEKGATINKKSAADGEETVFPGDEKPQEADLLPAPEGTIIPAKRSIPTFAVVLYVLATLVSLLFECADYYIAYLDGYNYIVFFLIASIALTLSGLGYFVFKEKRGFWLSLGGPALSLSKYIGESDFESCALVSIVYIVLAGMAFSILNIRVKGRSAWDVLD